MYTPEVLITFLIIGVVLVFVFLAFLEEVLIERPRKRKEARKWKEDYKEILKSEIILRNALKDVGAALPPCEKCGSPKMQLWEVDEYVMWTRCLSCKKKYNQTPSEGSNWLEVVSTALSGIYFLLDAYQNTANPDIKVAISSKLKFDYFGLRKGSLYCRAVEFRTSEK
ncbi:MAG: hypothetical protein AAFQ20_15135 [Bacteroidota bacterium]